MSTRVYEPGGSWGDCINFLPEWDHEKAAAGEQRIVGWKFRIPAEGDTLRVPMRKTGVALFAIKDVERTGDPDDMFFARLEFVGYENPTNTRKVT